MHGTCGRVWKGGSLPFGSGPVDSTDECGAVDYERLRKEMIRKRDSQRDQGCDRVGQCTNSIARVGQCINSSVRAVSCESTNVEDEIKELEDVWKEHHV